jgi:Flp pilus assembly protein TadG
MRRSPGERGDALVEFAVVATIFFVTILATMEYSRMVFAYNMVSFAAREGARYAAVRGSNATGHVASESEIQSYSAAKSAGWVSAGNVTVRCGTVAADITTTCASNNQPGRYVQVQTQATFTTGIPLLPLKSITLSSKTQMIISR